MKKIISLLFLCLSFSSWAIEQDEFLSLIEENMTIREKGINFYKNNIHKFSSDGLLTNKDLLEIYNFGEAYLQNRKKLLEIIKEAKKKIDFLEIVKFGTKKPTKFGFFYQYINPNDEKGQTYIKYVLYATISGQVLFDNYLALIAPYNSKKKTRDLLNRDFPGRNKEIDKLTANFYSPLQRKFLIRGIEIAMLLPQELLTPFQRHLLEVIKSSPVTAYMKDEGLFEPESINHLIRQFGGEFRYGVRSTSFETSRVFGNLMGMFQTRSGLMKDFSKEKREHISNRLKPLDILLEKTPFRLTDSFIPGYYGHVAIWTGTSEDLKELGIWDHPEIVPFHDVIQRGHHIVEALRPGVQINTLAHFLDIDDLAVIRPNDLTTDQVREYIIRTFQQIGKKYDFNFDVETNNLIVCSEIAYVVFHHINWPTDKVMGRSTISPDHVAHKAMPNGNFDVVMVYQSGEEIVDQFEEVFLKNIRGPEGIPLYQR